MKVELHLHTSRYSGCAVNSPSELMAGLVSAGYEAVFVTEHDAVWPDDELAELKAEFPRLAIFPGVELSLGAWDVFEHLLVLGTNDRRYLELAGGPEPDVAAILDRARAAGHMTVLAHPFRWDGGAEMLRRHLRPDAIELCTCNHDPEQAAVSAATARGLNLPVVNAGDVHSLAMVGRFWIETARPLTGPADLREMILAGEYANCPDDSEPA